MTFARRKAARCHHPIPYRQSSFLPMVVRLFTAHHDSRAIKQRRQMRTTVAVMVFGGLLLGGTVAWSAQRTPGASVPSLQEPEKKDGSQKNKDLGLRKSQLKNLI